MALCAQFNTLRETLEREGVTLSSFKPQGSPRFYLAITQGKAPLPVVINDHGEDGYTLYVLAEGLRIEDDVRLLTCRLT